MTQSTQSRNKYVVPHERGPADADVQAVAALQEDVHVRQVLCVQLDLQTLLAQGVGHAVHGDGPERRVILAEGEPRKAQAAQQLRVQLDDLRDQLQKLTKESQGVAK